jgi:hypothetical protein
MGAIPAGRDLDTVTVDEWKAASKDERAAFNYHWSRQGIVSFGCLSCGYPSPRGVAFCEACSPEDIEASRQRFWAMPANHLEPPPPVRPWEGFQWTPTR